MQDERYYTLQEVAELLKVNERTIRRLIKAKKLKATRVGNRYRITHTDLQAYLQSSS
jgi:excisionase family DNA binding protein